MPLFIISISLKVFLTALAVADDLGAIVVIALFYGETPNMRLLGIAVLIMVGIYFMGEEISDGLTAEKNVMTAVLNG